MKMKLVSITFILIAIALLVSGCGARKMDKKTIPVVDDIKETEDEQIPEEDSDLDVPDLADESVPVDPVENEPVLDDQPKRSVNLDGLDLGLGESVDEDIPEDDIEDLD